MKKSVDQKLHYKIQIVGGQSSLRKSLAYHLGLNPDFKVTHCEHLKISEKVLHEETDLVIINYNSKAFNASNLITKLSWQNSQLAIIVLFEAHDDESILKSDLPMVDAFLSLKSTTKYDLWDAVLHIRKTKSPQQDTSNQIQRISAYSEKIVGNSNEIKSIFKLMDKAVRSNINVYITGQTGTGKELVAKAIHQNSSRNKNKFVAINVAAIPKDLVESELFGHEKGSFTGANFCKKGKFEAANGGTLFLDEIAELDFYLQSKLLRVLQEKEICRIGSNEMIHTDFRLIIASHKELIEEVAKGNFREDLYYRIMGLTIELPSLSDRKSDILLLANHFLKRFCMENNLGAITLSANAEIKLINHQYPGNIRELKSVIEIAAIMCNGIQITTDDLQFKSKGYSKEICESRKTLKEYTRDIIKHHLELYKNNVIETAKALDIGKSTIYKMLKANEI
ncbi:MAG: sigma-54-dependent Fis family transcriptional regulator [Flavobacteriaceae bacterium]|nr:sigma-54-dependent Fis family transcriptional regulator [Flavobacteriaceae bacterium]